MKRRLFLIATVLFLNVLRAAVLLAQGNPALSVDNKEHVAILDDRNLKPTQITVEAWVNPTSLPRWATILMTSDSSWTTGYGLAHYEGTDDVHFFVNHFSDNNVTGTVVTGQWNHVAGTYDGSHIRLYINGQLVDSKPYTSVILHTPLSSVIGRTWNGFIEEVRIWNTARTQEDIQTTMHATLSGSEPSLVGYTSFSLSCCEWHKTSKYGGSSARYFYRRVLILLVFVPN